MNKTVLIVAIVILLIYICISRPPAPATTQKPPFWGYL